MVPHFFANAYNVFLLRQFFLTLPRELDESAMIDGAGPFRILWSVILPQSFPVLVAVSLFHIVFAWNDYFGPLIYLSTARENWPISVALSNFNGIYGSEPQLIQAGALMALILPVLLFFVAQRFFIQGIVITGVDKSLLGSRVNRARSPYDTAPLAAWAGGLMFWLRRKRLVGSYLPLRASSRP
jgi:multiple sugar transport system permease protein